MFISVSVGVFIYVSRVCQTPQNGAATASRRGHARPSVHFATLGCARACFSSAYTIGRNKQLLPSRRARRGVGLFSVPSLLRAGMQAYRTNKPLDVVPGVAVVAVCCTANQNLFFWPTYRLLDAGHPHDLIVVHRNQSKVPADARNANPRGRVLFLDKVTANGRELPYRAFGAYRFAYSVYKQSYDYFVFISDQTSLRCHAWLSVGLDLLSLHPKLGFGASQLFNGNDAKTTPAMLRTGYPHESHMRAPGPIFVKRSCLEGIGFEKWNFASDHEGEMGFGRKLVEEAGCVGVQVGNKLNLGFDSLGNPPLLPPAQAQRRSNYQHISHLLEASYFPSKQGLAPYHGNETTFFEQLFARSDATARKAQKIRSPFRHIGVQNVFYDLQPFNDLLYAPSLELAQKYLGERSLQHVDGNIYVIRRASTAEVHSVIRRSTQRTCDGESVCKLYST